MIPVVACSEPSDLQFRVELIRPEPRHRFVLPFGAQNVPCDKFRLIYGILDALKTDAPAAIGKRRAVAGGPDAVG